MKLLMTFLILLLSPLISSARPLFPPKPTPKNPKNHSPKHTNIIAKSNNQWDFLQQLVGCCQAAGRRYDGLAQLKNHFHRLGYMISSADPITDEFDDEFESAIRTYQRNFNLDVTGQLDSQTLDHIAQPRCGNPDIISGSTSGTHDHRHGFHIVSHYSFYDGMPRWKGRNTLTYGFLPTHGRSPILNGVGLKWVFGLAFHEWSWVIPLNFTEVDDAVTADIVIAFHSLDGPGGMLGNAYAPQQGEITMDADEDWMMIDGYEDTTSVPIPIDLLSVAVHEIGHALGLMHSTDIESVMYPIYPIGVSKATLSDDDIEGIQQLYGKNPNNHPVRSSPSSQRRPEPDIQGTSKTIINGAQCVDSRRNLQSGLIMALGIFLLL